MKEESRQKESDAKRKLIKKMEDEEKSSNHGEGKIKKKGSKE